jgi:hypothetical protein
MYTVGMDVILGHILLRYNDYCRTDWNKVFSWLATIWGVILELRRYFIYNWFLILFTLGGLPV